MDTNTKAILKKTILGLLAGGAVSAAYSMSSDKKKKKTDTEFGENEIVVPLSRKNFMNAVRKDAPAESTPKETAKSDVSAMSPYDLAALKRSLISKRAAASKIKDVNGPVSETTPIRNVKGVGSTFTRDKSSGRFAPATKKAGVFEDAGATMKENAGLVGGFATGLVAMKMVSDRIKINKMRRQVEDSRRKYVDMLSKEVNDDDTPYYSKRAEDRGATGTALGYFGLTGGAAAVVGGAIMYRIMENRRIKAEKAKDEDSSKYPKDKSVMFRFPKEGSDRFFE